MVVASRVPVHSTTFNSQLHNKIKHTAVCTHVQNIKNMLGTCKNVHTCTNPNAKGKKNETCWRCVACELECCHHCHAFRIYFYPCEGQTWLLKISSHRHRCCQPTWLQKISSHRHHCCLPPPTTDVSFCSSCICFRIHRCLNTEHTGVCSVEVYTWYDVYFLQEEDCNLADSPANVYTRICILSYSTAYSTIANGL